MLDSISLYQPRLCKNGFLEDYLLWTDSLEVHKDYHIWCALSIIGVVLGREVWLDRGPLGYIYPNIYTTLVGDSGTSHKSTAIGLASRTLSAIEFQRSCRLPNKVTAEKLLQMLSLYYEKARTATGYIIGSELVSLLGKSKFDPSLIHILTDLYDSPDFWSSGTLYRGVECLQKVCLSFLGGTTEEWLKGCLPEESLGGGFFARFNWVNRKPTGILIANPEDFMTPQKEQCYENCIHDLRVISTLKGSFTWDTKAKSLYTTWYEDYNRTGDCPHFMKGYFGRKGTTVLKIAMISSASVSNSRVLSERDIFFAIQLLNSNEAELRALVMVMGQTEEGVRNEKLEKIVKNFCLGKGEPISHSNLLRRVQYCMNAEQMSKVIDTLEQAGKIQVIYDPLTHKRKEYNWIGSLV